MGKGESHWTVTQRNLAEDLVKLPSKHNRTFRIWAYGTG